MKRIKVAPVASGENRQVAGGLDRLLGGNRAPRRGLPRAFRDASKLLAVQAGIRQDKEKVSAIFFCQNGKIT
ncbi:MAG TPA: hypothetical protein DCR55_15555 [Lentisphaeria bacterium]|nr:hypothetical protein [Lentisphaeria bacterium]